MMVWRPFFLGQYYCPHLCQLSQLVSLLVGMAASSSQMNTLVSAPAGTLSLLMQLLDPAWLYPLMIQEQEVEAEDASYDVEEPLGQIFALLQQLGWFLLSPLKSYYQIHGELVPSAEVAETIALVVHSLCTLSYQLLFHGHALTDDKA